MYSFYILNQVYVMICGGGLLITAVWNINLDDEEFRSLSSGKCMHRSLSDKCLQTPFMKIFMKKGVFNPTNWQLAAIERRTRKESVLATGTRLKVGPLFMYEIWNHHSSFLQTLAGTMKVYYTNVLWMINILRIDANEHVELSTWLRAFLA